MKLKIELIDKRKETEDIYSFFFRPAEPFDWTPGQHCLFRLTDTSIEGKNFRTFSLASVMSENCIMFSTRIVDIPSDFKKRLLELKIGEQIEMEGPHGAFCVRDYQGPLALIAGGVGIPPIRAILKGIEESKTQPEAIEVFYIDSRKEYAYRAYLEDIDQKNKRITVHLLSEIEDFNKKLLSFVERNHKAAQYYVSGSPSMITAVKDKLEVNGIDKAQIHYDSFIGYE